MAVECDGFPEKATLRLYVCVYVRVYKCQGLNMEFLCSEHNSEWVFTKVRTFIYVFTVVLGKIS